jgi:hypothetical protein
MDTHVKAMFGIPLAIIAGISMMQAIGGSADAVPATPTTGEANAVAPKTEAPAALASDYPIESCKAAIALIMDRDPKSISGKKLANGLVHVSYKRPEDGKRWQARCELIDDDHIRWAAFDAFGDGQQGRWRDEDSIQASIEDGRLQINLDQSGVIQKHESYDLSALS